MTQTPKQVPGHFVTGADVKGVTAADFTIAAREQAAPAAEVVEDEAPVEAEAKEAKAPAKKASK
jgi:hypothetical protein